MGNIIYNNNGSRNLTATCEKPLSVLLYGDNICKQEFGNQCKYINFEKDNCSNNTFKAICECSVDIENDKKDNNLNNMNIYPTIKKNTELDMPHQIGGLVQIPTQISQRNNCKKSIVNKISLSESDNLLNHLNEESLIYPKEQFNNSMNTEYGFNTFFLIVICIMFVLLCLFAKKYFY